jgi:hypothetical protein
MSTSLISLIFPGSTVYVLIIYFLIGLAMNPEAFFYFLFMVTQGLIVSEACSRGGP